MKQEYRHTKPYRGKDYENKEEQIKKYSIVEKTLELIEKEKYDTRTKNN
jgi:hypothetical protein